MMINDLILKSKNGDNDATFMIGYLYASGSNGVEQNYSKAFHYYKLSAKKNHRYAHINLGKMYFYGQGVDINYGRALYHTENAYKGDDDYDYELDRLIFIGKIYLSNFRLHNFKKAYISFQNALKIFDEPEALWEYGKMIFYGQYAQRDKQRALKYFRKSAALGHQKAQNFIEMNYHVH